MRIWRWEVVEDDIPIGVERDEPFFATDSERIQV